MQKKYFTYLTRESHEWNGQSMRSAHAGRGIQTSDFDIVARHIVTTMRELDIN